LPTYEYRCIECGHQYERREGFDAPATQRCPRCHCESRRILHAPPVLFKGSGFYVTDNRKSGLVGSASASAGSNGDNGNGDKEIAGVEAASTSEVKSSSKAPDKKSEATATG
jgi:putative FmdB family regulatory protein